jgi:hypothetical protein
VRFVFLGIALAVLFWPSDSKPGPGPVPIVQKDKVWQEDGLMVAVVYETADSLKYKAGQLACLRAANVREWLRQSDAQFRFIDDDTVFGGDEVKWQKAVEAASGKSYPWLIIQNAEVFQGPLPNSPDEFITLLEKYK